MTTQTKRKRSRADTEQRFMEAVLELISESGCSELGVNLVAQRTGADKVLIYRYFGDFEGLLSATAKFRVWLPPADELIDLRTRDPRETLYRLIRNLTTKVRNDAATWQLLRWRHATKNPLTETISGEWNKLWTDVAATLGDGLSPKERANWTKACTLASLIAHSELIEGGLDLEIIDTFTDRLTAAFAGSSEIPEDIQVEESLPTNLL